MKNIDGGNIVSVVLSMPMVMKLVYAESAHISYPNEKNNLLRDVATSDHCVLLQQQYEDAMSDIVSVLQPWLCALECGEKEENTTMYIKFAHDMQGALATSLRISIEHAIMYYILNKWYAGVETVAHNEYNSMYEQELKKIRKILCGPSHTSKISYVIY